MKNANDKAKETRELILNWRAMFFVLSRAWKKIKVPMRNCTSEFFVYFSMFYFHDEKKNTLPHSLPSSKFMDPSIINYLSSLQYVFPKRFLVQSVFLFCSSRLLFLVEYKLPDMNLTWDTVSHLMLGCRYITDCFVAQQVFLTRHQYLYHSITTHPT